MIKIQYRRDLWKLFRNKPGAAAEIGVAEGNNSEDMLKWKLSDGRDAVTRLYMVDRWWQVESQKGDAAMPEDWHEGNFRKVQSRIVPYGPRAVVLRGHSTDMAKKVRNGTLKLLYIDGDHTEEGCFADLRAWTPKVMPGGIVALHDFLNENYGVRQAVETFCAGNFKIHVIEEDKPEDAGAWFQIC